MYSMNTTRAMLISMGAAVLILAPATTSLAKTLTCDAKWEIRTKRSGQTKKRTVRSFKAKGQCGATVPNRCRKRAKALAQDCMYIHWKTRHDRKTPQKCYSANISGYCVKDIKCMAEKMACRNRTKPDDPGSWHGRTFEIWTITSGKKKCRGSRRVSSAYGSGDPSGTLDCARVDFSKPCCTGPCGSSCEIARNGW